MTVDSMRPDVSVVVPTHNRLALVKLALASILRQQGVSIEIIVVDEASRDGTNRWLEALASADPRVKVVHHDTPKGAPGARNAGIERASGRLVAFCDDDDLWAPYKLLKQVEALTATGSRWACTAAVLVDESCRIVGHHHVQGGNIARDILVRNAVSSGASSVVAELDLVREVGGFDETLKSSEDWDLWIRIAQHSPIAAVDRPLIAYRQVAGSMSANVARMRSERTRIIERYRELADDWNVNADDASYERYLAKQLLRSGSRFRSAGLFAQLVMKHGKVRELPRIAAALFAPGLTHRMGDSRAAASVPSDWRMEAEAWLGEAMRASTVMDSCQAVA